MERPPASSSSSSVPAPPARREQRAGDAPTERDGRSAAPAPSAEPPRDDGTGVTAERVVRFALGALALAGTAWVLWYFGRATALSQQVSVDAISSVVQTLEARLLDELPFLEEGFLLESLRDIADTLFRDDRLQQTFSSAFGLLTDVVYAVVVVPFVTFFFLKDGTRLRHGLLRWVPNRYFEVTLAILDKVESSLGRYLRALLVQCTAVATVASLLLSFTGLNYAVAVGLFAGLANSIPYFGPAVGFIAGSLVAVAQTGDFALIMPIFVAMALTQLSDNLIFQPFIFSKAAQAHPLVILFVVLIGAQLAGIVGMLVAIPVTTVLRGVFREVFWSIRHYRILRA
ncbi:MAG: AI-2E family transporter [Bacteroidetes bacterium QH_2_63_10]|nr:MAG: AI-2E family transporter [Bacteroidetes bacterium QH_2_63_10]